MVWSVQIRAALAVLVPLILATHVATAAEPRAALLVTAGEGIGAASLEVVGSTVGDMIENLDYELVPGEEVDEAVSTSCASPACSTTGEPALLLATLGASVLVVLSLEEEGEEIRVDISIHDVAGQVQKATNVAKMSAVLAKSVKLLLEVMPAPTTLAPPPPASVTPPDDLPASATAAADAAVSTAIHEHHHTSPCSGQSCSGHGRCVIVKNLPACACDEGYVPDTETGLTCTSAIYEEPRPEEVDSHHYLRKARRLAVAGFVLEALGTASLMGGWLFAGLDCGDPFCAMIGFIPGTVLMHSIAGPLRLHALAIANRHAGRKVVDGYVVAGWVGYGLTLATLAPMPFVPFFGSEEVIVAFPIAFTAVYIASAIITSIAGGRALGLSARVLEPEEYATLVPYAAPVPGGFSLGLAGSF